MKGDAKVIERLNEALLLELGAVNQYWLHCRLLEDWGYALLAKKEREESIEEMRHADRIIKRIKFGMTFEEISRSVVDSGIVQTDDSDSYVAKRVAQHRSPGPPILRRFDDGRRVQTSERTTSGDGIVSVYTDLTELKNSEQRAANANLLIQESLRYGRRIQNAVLPDPENFARATTDHFLIWEPRDVVGGDFFWFHELEDGYMIVVGDCTGHGAPGAFLTRITCSILDRLLESGMGADPSRLLNALHCNFRTLLGQDQENAGTNDGLETCVCVINEKKRQMTFAGAHLSLFCARAGHIEEIKGVKAGIGYGRYPPNTVYTSKIIDISSRPSFYIATEGMTDQVGGHQAAQRGTFLYRARQGDQRTGPRFARVPRPVHERARPE